MTTVTEPQRPNPSAAPPSQRAQAGAFNARQLWTSLPEALRKLHPAQMWRNPVMLIVEVGAALTTVLAIALPFSGAASTTILV